MAIWTSRYSNKELANNKEKYYCIGISLGKPKFPLGYTLQTQCYSIAPKGYMLKMDYEEYVVAYRRKLEGIGSDKIINMVKRFEQEAMSQYKDLVLLCYEDVRNPEDWCHRTIFAQWYAEHTGEYIEELFDPSPVKQKKKTEQKNQDNSVQKTNDNFAQLSLFDICNA